MAKRTWKDRVVEFPRRFKDQFGNVLELTPFPGTVLEEGTPVNASNLNGLEEDLESHKADYATQEKLGHVRTKTNENGEILFPPSPIGTTKMSEMYVLPGWLAQNPGTDSNVGNGSIYYIPIFVDEKTTYDRIGCHIKTAGSGSVLNIRLYKSENLIPTGQILNFGDIDASTTGAKEILTEFTLEQGFYFIGVKVKGNQITLQGNLDATKPFVAPTSGITSTLIQAPWGCVLGVDVAYNGDMANPATPPTKYFGPGTANGVKFRIK